MLPYSEQNINDILTVPLHIHALHSTAENMTMYTLIDCPNLIKNLCLPVILFSSLKNFNSIDYLSQPITLELLIYICPQGKWKW